MNQQRILITGATGLIGRRVSKTLIDQGFELVVVGRSSEPTFRQKFSLPCQYFQWSDPERDSLPLGALKVDGVINLMGEPIGNRWTKSNKEKFRTSRISS